MESHVVTLIGKPGCHLCDDAREAIASVIADLPSGSASVTVVEHSILDDAELFERFAEEIPVVLIDGWMHTYWRVDASRLTAALTSPA